MQEGPLRYIHLTIPPKSLYYPWIVSEGNILQFNPENKINKWYLKESLEDNLEIFFPKVLNINDN
jgi:hypothetical protein